VKIVILGSGQDAGIPQVGCSCSNCEAARKYPSRSRTGPSIALVSHDGSGFYLIDASTNFTKQVDYLLGNHIKGGFEALKGIFITHVHLGHIMGLGMLGREASEQTGIQVHAPPGVIGFLENNMPFKEMILRKNIIPNSIMPGQELPLFEGSSMAPFQVPHRPDAITTYAYLIKRGDETILYLPDTDEITPEIVDLVSKSDISIVDGTFYNNDEISTRDITEIPHPFIQESIPLLKDHGSRIIFTHINHTNPVNDPVSQASGHVIQARVEVARENMVI
jgi:pyrroloquinoline quinone biosynthesis protein B